MDPGPCGVPSAVSGLSGLSGLSDPESQDRPCLIVEDSQPDSTAIEDDPESSYRALLTRRLSTLRTTGGLELISGSQSADQSQPPIFEMNPSFEESEVLDVSEGRGRCEQMDSRGASQSLQHEEGISQFGFLELSQSQDFGPEPVQDQIRTRPNDESLKTRSRPSPLVPAQALPHSQDRVLNQDQDQLLSSQEDLFDKTGPLVRSSSPSRLALLQLSGCATGTLVHNSLSQSSVDFVAPTPENLTPMIVPSSPTEHDEPMDQSEHRDLSTAVCELQRPLSVPSQPQLSHDVFVPTQSQTDTFSPAPQTSSPAPQTSSPAPQTSSPAPQTCSLNLCINTEADDEEATQIEALDQDTVSHSTAPKSQESQQSHQSHQSQSLRPSTDSQNSRDSQRCSNLAPQLAANSQNRVSRFSQEAKNHSSRPNSQEYQNKNVNSAKANSQPPESAPDSSSASQTKALNKDHEKMTQTFSQKVKANSQPAGSAGGRIVPESQAEIMNVEDEKKSTNGSAPQPQTAVKNVNHGKCSQNSAKASSEPHGSAPRPASDSQTKVLNVNNEKMTETFSLKAKASSQPVASAADTLVSDSQAKMKAHSQPTRPSPNPLGPSTSSTRPAPRPTPRPAPRPAPRPDLSPHRPQDGAARAEQQSLGVLELSQSEMLTSTEQGAKMSAAGKDKRDGKCLDSSGELSFHFTLPKEDELIGRSVSATPPHMSQLKQAPRVRHSTPIEVNSPSQRSDLSVGSDIIPGAEGADGKLSLRMKLVTPVEESSERFSLQRPSLSDGVSVCPSSSSAPHSASVFSRVRHVHCAPSGHSCRSPSPQSHSQSDASSQLSTANEDAEKPQGVAEARGLDRSDPETPPPRHAGPSHRRHVRTIQEVRTTVTRIITDTFYEDGKEVERSVREESDDPVVNFQVMDVSPSRTVGSMTSGDLADISSSTGATGTSSGHLLPPPSRGAKARGGGARRGSPVSPRGNRRGRPPARPAPPSAPPAGSSPPPQDSSSFVGLRVVAKWSSNGYFYSGRITQDFGVHPGGTGPGLGSGSESGPESGPGENRFRLRFDDGYECELWARDILLCDPIPLESEVTGLNQDQTLCTGEVVAYRSDGPELQYCLQPPRGQQRVWFPRSAVILSLEQGNRLREKHSLGPYAPPPLLGHAADISLDNLVEGKRKRRGGQSGLSTPPRTPRTPRQKPSPGSGPSPHGSKRKMSSDHPPAAKRGRRPAVQQVSVLNTSDSDPAPCDPAPCDVSCDLTATQGPRPQNTALFEGFVFLLTSSSERDRLSNRLSNHEDLVQTGPYNKSYTESQLQSGGGIILKEFNHQQCQAAYQPLLIADQHCCNRPYLLSLVSGVPCVSHLWVRDCCRDETLHNYRSYLLPAGRGPGGGVKEWRPRCRPFQELKVLLLLTDHIQFWTELVQLGGGTAVVRTPEELADLPPDSADVLVSGSVSGPVSGPVSGLALPQVSVDWIIDSVVCGEPLDYSGFLSAVDSSSS